MTDGDIGLVFTSCNTAWLALVLSGLAKTFTGHRIAEAVYYNIKPFAVPLLVIKYVASVASSSGFNAGAALYLVIDVSYWWFVLRGDHDDDDRWRKRGRRLAAKIRQLDSGRLAVDPT